MRTYKWMAAIVLLLGMTSCGTYYRMVSQVNSDGSMHREVYAYGDSVSSLQETGIIIRFYSE